MARVVRGTYAKGVFRDDPNGPIWVVLADTGIVLSPHVTEAEAQAELEGIQAESRAAERKKQREEAAVEEAAEKKRREQGIVEKEVAVDPEARALIDRIMFLATVARTAAKAKISVKVFDDDGKPTVQTERVANEDFIFNALLNTKINPPEAKR